MQASCTKQASAPQQGSARWHFLCTAGAAHLQEAHVVQGALLQEAVYQLDSTTVVEERQLQVVQLPADNRANSSSIST